MYLTFDDYVQYGGTLGEVPFYNLCFEASSLIDWYTFGRLMNEDYADLPEAVKRCANALVNLIQLKSAILNSTLGSREGGSQSAGLISSQSNDGVSVSYNVLSSQQLLDYYKGEVTQIINQYLTMVVNSLGRMVLYRGLYPGE